MPRRGRACRAAAERRRARRRGERKALRDLPCVQPGLPGGGRPGKPSFRRCGSQRLEDVEPAAAWAATHVARLLRGVEPVVPAPDGPHVPYEEGRFPELRTAQVAVGVAPSGRSADQRRQLIARSAVPRAICPPGCRNRRIHGHLPEPFASKVKDVLTNVCREIVADLWGVFRQLSWGNALFAVMMKANRALTG